MFDYTKLAFKETADKFKKADYIRNVASQCLYIAYLLYALIASFAAVWANALLLALSVAYFAFFIYATKIKTEKRLKRRVAVVFKRCKLLVKFLTLSITIYGAFATAKHVTPLSLFFLSFMIVAFVLQVLFDVISSLIVNRLHFFLEAIEADVEELKKPVTTAKNFFKKLTGAPVEERTPSKTRAYLDEKVALSRQEKRELRKRERQERKNKRRPAPIEKENED